MFKETLEFKDAINIFYSKQTITLQNRIPTPQTWVVTQKMLEVLILMVTQCVLNQS
jgi:hypothetical protein